MLITALTLACLLTFVVSGAAHFGYAQNRWPALAERDYRSDAYAAFLLALISATIPVLGILLAYVQFEGFRYGFKIPGVNKTFHIYRSTK